MICFCEDCGAKNDLVEEQAVQDGKVKFRCTACNYGNAYALPSTPEGSKPLPKILSSCPEVIAAFLFREGERPVILRQPNGLKTADLEQLAIHMVPSFLAARALFPDIHQQTATFGEKHVIVQMTGPHQFLFLINTAFTPSQSVTELLKMLPEEVRQ